MLTGRGHPKGDGNPGAIRQPETQGDSWWASISRRRRVAPHAERRSRTTTPWQPTSSLSTDAPGLSKSAWPPRTEHFTRARPSSKRLLPFTLCACARAFISSSQLPGGVGTAISPFDRPGKRGTAGGVSCPTSPSYWVAAWGQQSSLLSGHTGCPAPFLLPVLTSSSQDGPRQGPGVPAPLLAAFRSALYPWPPLSSLPAVQPSLLGLLGDRAPRCRPQDAPGPADAPTSREFPQLRTASVTPPSISCSFFSPSELSPSHSLSRATQPLQGAGRAGNPTPLASPLSTGFTPQAVCLPSTARAWQEPALSEGLWAGGMT